MSPMQKLGYFMIGFVALWLMAIFGGFMAGQQADPRYIQPRTQQR